MTPSAEEIDLEGILVRAEGGGPLTRKDILALLSIRDRKEGEALFSAARRVRGRSTGGKVFLYGFVYLSTFCRNDCHFCSFRSSNSLAIRYRKTRDQVVRAALELGESGVHLMDLTMGEDPRYLDEEGAEALTTLVASVKSATELPIMVSPGQVGREFLVSLRAAGASWYACYQETHNRSLFKKIRPAQDFDARMEGKRMAREEGILTEEGILLGMGESTADISHSLQVMGEEETDQVRVMSLVPQEGTPFSNRRPGDPWLELKTMAVMRLLFPDRLIPASLDIAGLDGLRERLDAGANVITSLVPPGGGWAGVAQSRLDIREGRRTVASVLPVLEASGLEPGTRREYDGWMAERRKRLGRA